MAKFQLLLGILWIVVLIAPAIEASEGSICLHHDDNDHDHDHESYREAICEEFNWTYEQVTEIMSDQYCPIERRQSLATSCPYAERVFGLWDLESDDSGISKALTLVAQIYQTEKGVCLKDFHKIARRCFDDKKRRSLCKVHTKYRSIDGCGNNEEHHEWGTSDIPFGRLASKNYEDGIYNMRKSVVDGSDLPNPRRIVTDVLTASTGIDVSFTPPFIYLLIFAIAHDVGYATPKTRCGSGAEIQCCTRGFKNKLPANLLSPDCIPIDIPSNDTFYEDGCIRCMNMVRSELGRTAEGVETGEILNRATSYVDLSFIYGNHESETKSIRLWKDGKLRMDDADALPVDTRGNYLQQMQDIIAFPIFSIFPIVFAKAHNFIACELKKVNHRWDDERLFQEARRILIAIWHLFALSVPVRRRALNIEGGNTITGVLGATSAGILRDSLRFEEEPVYSADYNPATTVEFHTYMNALLYVIDDSLVYENFDGTTESIPHSDTIGKFETTVKQNFDLALRGSLTSLSNSGDYSEEIYNKIDKNEDGYGIDLIALGIQQSRDHGVPSFLEMRNYCNLSVYEAFADFEGSINADNLALLQAIYQDPEDVDFYVGGMLEFFGGLDAPPDGMSVFDCVYIENLLRKLYGDIYYLYHPENPYPFTEDQLDAIMGLGGILFCSISEPLRELLCGGGYQAPDFTPFKDDHHHHHHHHGHDHDYESD